MNSMVPWFHGEPPTIDRYWGHELRMLVSAGRHPSVIQHHGAFRGAEQGAALFEPSPMDPWNDGYFLGKTCKKWKFWFILDLNVKQFSIVMLDYQRASRVNVIIRSEELAPLSFRCFQLQVEGHGVSSWSSTQRGICGIFAQSLGNKFLRGRALWRCGIPSGNQTWQWNIYYLWVIFLLKAPFF